MTPMDEYKPGADIEDASAAADSEYILSRREGESDFDYHRRILYAKLVDHTLDMDYSDLSPYLYGREYASDVARRMAYGSLRTLKMAESEGLSRISDPGIRSEIDDKIQTLEKARRQYSDQRREYSKLLSSEGRREHLYEILKESADNLSETVGRLEDIEPDTPIAEGCFGENEAVLVLSDWHYGMVTDNAFNTYNTDICKSRVSAIVKAAKDRIQLHDCSTLHIVVLGDLFHGAIHTSARVASEELVCDQIMQVSEILAQAIAVLGSYVGTTYVYMTYGNHGRTVQNKNDNIHADNMETLIPWWLKQRLSRCSGIYVIDDSSKGDDRGDHSTEAGWVDHEFVFLNVNGHGFCATHGDLDSVRTVPKSLFTLFRKKYRSDVEYVLLGDRHHRESVEDTGVTAMLCGALCGTDDYANDRRLFANPSQLLLIVSPQCGVDAEYRLHC